VAPCSRTMPFSGAARARRDRHSRGTEYDFVSRFFAPGSGVDEDPVTGAGALLAGPSGASRLSKSEFVAYQASPRGGIVPRAVEVIGEGSADRRSRCCAVSC